MLSMSKETTMQLVTRHMAGTDLEPKPGDPLHPATPESIYFTTTDTPDMLFKVQHVNPDYSAAIWRLKPEGVVFIFTAKSVMYNINEIGRGTVRWRLDFPEHYLQATDLTKQFMREVYRQFTG